MAPGCDDRADRGIVTPAVLPERIEVPGVEVRVLRESDAAAVSDAVVASLEDLRRFMPWAADEPIGDAARGSLLAGWEAQRADGGDAVYGIFAPSGPGGHQGLGASGRLLGAAGAHRRRAEDGLEIGYWLRPTAQGRGIMTGVVLAMTRVLLEVPGITHVEICTDQANTRSAAVAQRCGYRLVGREARIPVAPAETGWHLVWRIEGAEGSRPAALP